MGKIIVRALVEGGKAVPGPPLGPSLAQYKVNIGQVVSAINEKTKEFSGMQIPIIVEIDTETKKFDIKVGRPSVAALIKKELKLEKTAAKEIAQGVNRFIFFPVREIMANTYKTKSSTEENRQADATPDISKTEPPKPDTYREPIE